MTVDKTPLVTIRDDHSDLLPTTQQRYEIYGRSLIMYELIN